MEPPSRWPDAIPARRRPARVPDLGELQGSLQKLDIVTQDSPVVVKITNVEIVLRHLGAERQQKVLVIGGARLRLGLRRFQRPARAAPDVGFVTGVERQGKCA